MNEDVLSRSGGRILVDQLGIHGADTAFCVPGESYLDVLNAFYDVRDRMRLIVCRQEGGAAFMAEAYGKLTGRPGICFVTRGPGATNASIGVHTAYQDSTPVILFIGQVGSDVVEREAFQEMDYRRMFGQMAKWVAQIDRADRIPEFVSHAFHTAVSGRPGPVVLSLPEDMLVSQAVAIDARPYARVKAHPGIADMDRLREMLAQAQKPLVILGGGWLALVQGLQGADYDVFGRVVAARSQVTLDQVLAARIEMNVHADPGCSISAGLQPHERKHGSALGGLRSLGA